ncbi:hypothetical protein YPPY10_0778, partial [Yersinia pestis PY-10]
MAEKAAALARFGSGTVNSGVLLGGEVS